MPEMVQRQRGIWNYVALRVVALQGPRERLLAGIDPTALSHAREKADLTARAVFNRRSAGTSLAGTREATLPE